MRWNKTKKTVIGVAVALAAAALIAVFCSPAAAKVTGVCSNCHTMHDSQGGTAMATGGPHATLLMNSCVGCHSSGDSSTTYALGGSNVPVVNYTGGSEPTDYLAGGNFYWVADNGGNEDAKGHNVLGISAEDAYLTLSGPEEAPGNQIGGTCGTTGCHSSLARENTRIPELGSGCEGCHLRVKHHADDRNDPVTGGYRVTTDDQGCYRFLVAHSGDNHVKDFGVHGIEDGDWQQLSQASANKHNEYIGVDGYNNTYINLSPSNPTVTAFCCGCHGEFHKEQDGAGNWIRHPSDAVIPATGEYQYAFASAGDGAAGIYDPLVPVAKPSLTAVSSDVNLGTDMVMCLSCHRPHGSPYDDLLRWDYSEMNAGGGDNATGCFACHTTKDTGG